MANGIALLNGNIYPAAPTGWVGAECYTRISFPPLVAHGRGASVIPIFQIKGRRLREAK